MNRFQNRSSSKENYTSLFNEIWLRDMCSFFSRSERPMHFSESFLDKQRPQETETIITNIWTSCHVWLMASYSSIWPVFRMSDNQFIGDTLILTNFPTKRTDGDADSTNARQPVNWLRNQMHTYSKITSTVSSFKALTWKEKTKSQCSITYYSKHAAVLSQE